MKLSFASSALAVLLAFTTLLRPTPTQAVNFLIIQPDDMKFYEDWSPPPHMPWPTGYPGEDYPGNSTLPNINKLRQEGLSMTAAYAAAPKCGTSRYSTVTGRYPSRSSHARGRTADGDIPDATIPNTKLRDVTNRGGVCTVPDCRDCTENNIAQVFSKNGYKTGMVGKWHLSRTSQLGGTIANVKTEVMGCGFDDVEAMYPDNLSGQSWANGIDHNMEYVAYKAIEFINDNTANDWFLYVNPTVPHTPDVLAAMDVDCRITVDGNFTASMSDGWEVDGMTQQFGNDCFAYRNNVKARAQGSTQNADLGSIWVDDAIGAIYKALQDTSQLADTVILFQLDHGQAQKDKIWEGGVRIPQFIHYPAGLGTSPRTWEGLVSTIDIGPTMLDFANLTAANPAVNGLYSMDGKSWKDAIDNVSGSGDDWIANRCLFFESDQDRAVRCGCDKFALFSASSPEVAMAVNEGYTDFTASTTEALFDLCDASRSYIVADPSEEGPESVNIASSQPAKVDDLRDLLQCHLNNTAASSVDDPVYTECSGSVATPAPTISPAPTCPNANGGTPELVDSSPWEDDILASNAAQVVSATVLDDNIQRVRFNVRFPNQTTTSFTTGIRDTALDCGDQSTHNFEVDTSANGPGKYGYKLRIQDNSANSVEIPLDGSWIEFVVADNAAELVDAARAEIAQIINDFPQDQGNLAAKFVRHGFHDAVGGCDGCVDMTNPDNAGLDIAIAALDPVVEVFEHEGYGVTRADLWVLATLEGARISQDIGNPEEHRDFEMTWIGRPGCEDLNVPAACEQNSCTQELGPHRDLPSPSLDTHALLDFFAANFSFTPRDTVAIMGAHTLGQLKRENSGYDGQAGWVGNINRLNNAYYDDLIGGQFANSTEEEHMNGGNWQQNEVDNSDLTIDNKWQWERNGPVGEPPFVMLNSDIALVRDLDGFIGSEGNVTGCQFRRNRNPQRCPKALETFDIAVEFAFDNAQFLADFESALKKMLEVGDYDISGGCLTPPCSVGSVARRNLRG